VANINKRPPVQRSALVAHSHQVRALGVVRAELQSKVDQRKKALARWFNSTTFTASAESLEMIATADADLMLTRRRINKLISDLEQIKVSNLKRSSCLRVEETGKKHASGICDGKDSRIPDLLSEVCKQLSMRRLDLLRELSQLYSIEYHGRYRSIRGIALPSLSGLRKCELRDEESISAALGFLVHRVSVAARVVDFPMTLRIVAYGSRSSIKNPSSRISLVDLPLFYRGLEKSKFTLAVNLLRDSIAQFIQSRGKRIEGVEDLLELADML
jgi:hypothetical protein